MDCALGPVVNRTKLQFGYLQHSKSISKYSPKTETLKVKNNIVSNNKPCNHHFIDEKASYETRKGN